MPRLKKKSKDGREVIYKEAKTKIYQGKEALTADIAKEILGWEELPKTSKQYHFSHPLTGKVQFNNNDTNRAINTINVMTLLQDLLNGRWKLNGETIIIGETGRVLNGQHQLIALVLADLTFQGMDKDERKEINLLHPPTLEKVVVAGISEEDAVVNTMDTAKPRSLADVIYRSPYFQDLAPKVREKLSRILDYAVKLLWRRTGALSDPYAPRRTHAEAIDFLERHPTLVDCCKHIYEENGDQTISRYVSLGSAAGLMYLFSTMESDRNTYIEGGESEQSLHLSTMDEAEEFWVLLAAGDRKFNALREILGKHIDESEYKLSPKEQEAYLVKAWNLFISKKSMGNKALQLSYEKDEEGIEYLDEYPVVGGIDIYPEEGE